jgi:hypothetical protein
MKTKRITSMPGGLIAFLMVALILLTITGCQKENSEDLVIAQNREYSEHLKTPTFKVYPEGTTVSVFGGAVVLEFPEGVVAAPTLFIIRSIQVNDIDLEGRNMYKLGFFLEGESPDQKLKDVSVRVNYDLDAESWQKSAPGPKDRNLTIYHVSPEIYDYQTINSIGGCCVDCSSKMIQGCINSCGYFVVGVK